MRKDKTCRPRTSILYEAGVEQGARANAATYPLGVFHVCRGRVAQLTRSTKKITMHQAPQAERIELHKWQSAYSSLNEARGILHHIRDEAVGDEHPLHHALWAAFHVFYAKPFKQRPIIRISQDVVPQNLRNAHDAIITLRDKLFAHSDLNGPNLDEGDLVSSLFVSFHPNQIQQVVFAVRYGFPAPEAVTQYDELITALLQIFHTNCAQLFKEWMKNMQIEPHQYYRINIGSEQDDVLLPVKKGRI